MEPHTISHATFNIDLMTVHDRWCDKSNIRLDQSGPYTIMLLQCQCTQSLQWNVQNKLEQLERLRSEDTPRRLMITHTIESCWIPSQN